MLLQPLSKNVLYIFIIIAIVILPLAGRLGVKFMDASADRNGHGIDGIGAAILSAGIVKIAMYVAIGIYLFLVVKIIQSVLYYEDVPGILIAVPFIPIAVLIARKSYYTFRLNKERASYTVEDYVAEVKQGKSRCIRSIDGTNAIYAFEYIISCVARDSYWLSTRLKFDKARRKAILDEAIPLLMRDLEQEDLCACKFYDGADHFFPTEIEHWEYKADSDLLVVKFTHNDEPDEFDIKYFGIGVE